MPVKNSLMIKREDDGSSNSDQSSRKDDSYSPQSPSWSRELRNRFVFSSKERSRNSGDCSLHPRYGKQDIRPRQRIRRSRIPVPLDERQQVFSNDMIDDSDDDIYEHGEEEEDADEDEDDIFSPCRQGRVRRSRRRHVRLSYERSRQQKSCRSSRRLGRSVMNGHDSSLEKQGDDNQEGVRRSTRQRKLLYDNFNTSWILGTQTLRGYPMFPPDKEDGDKDLPEGGVSRAEDEDEEEEEEEENVNKEGCSKKRRRTVAEMPPVPDDNFEDMYSRVKRPRRSNRRMIFSPEKSPPRSRKLNEDSEDVPTETQTSQSSTDESGDEVVERREKYHLRKTKPAVDRFQINVEPTRRSSRILRSVLSSVRRRHHHNESSSSSSDDERFDRKKVNKHNKSRNRCLPINFNATNLSASNKSHEGGKKLADINPMQLDTSIRFENVGGLEDHIRCLKEMVVFPMLYQEVFDRFCVRPPKGVLFHGPPGTGKTLIARALANECSQGDRKVSFFMRKGADCLSKWVGESERQLRLLFEQAYLMRPSIIFFDEIDGLAPVRSSKQDQIHASIVSTLLALMDGLDNRGEVIVIGATNRIDAIDPALRRPGRFDRELFFPLPAKKERQEILKIHVSRWHNPPTPVLLGHMAEQAVGYCGSDLQALCSEAVIQALRRQFPQIYNSTKKLLLDADKVKVQKIDFIKAKNMIVPAAHRVAPCIGRKLTSVVEPLLKESLESAISILKTSFPFATCQSVSSMRNINCGKIIHRPQLLLVGSSPAQGQTSYLGPALLNCMEHVPVHTLDLSKLYGITGCSPEEACVQVFQEARRNTPSIIYVPGISVWWSLVTDTLQAVFLSHLRLLDPGAPVLLLSTSDLPYNRLPSAVCSIFSEYRGEVLKMDNPDSVKREAFFKPLFLTEALKTPKVERKPIEPLPELPLAPPPVPRKLTEEEQKTLYENEEGTLRELRIFLREICSKLARNRQFYMFTKPVDIDEVPDYLSIIKQPMDLETMMTKIDLHRYACAQDFLDDVDLLCRNALEYNPDKDPADKLIRHRACSLRDTAYTLIKAEMDSDFEEQCKGIAKARRERAESPSRFAPDFVQTKPEASASKENTQPDNDKTLETSPLSNSKNSSPNSVETNVIGSGGSPGLIKSNWRFSDSCLVKKRRRSAWSRGLLKHNGGKKKKLDRRLCSLSPNSANNVHCNSLPSSIGNDMLSLKQESSDDVRGMHNKRFNGDCSSDSVTSSKTTKGNTHKTGSNIVPVTSFIHNFQNLEAISNCDTASQDDNVNEFEATADHDTGAVSVKKSVVIDRDKLKGLLVKTVNITKRCPVETLIELHVQLNKCVLKYSKSLDRTSLPQELEKELDRFQAHFSNLSSTAS